MPSPPRVLAKSEQTSALACLDGWRWEGNRLERWFECPDFPSAVAWVASLVDVAESMGHHPDVDIRYRRVRLVLATHDCGGVVTDWDVELAARIDRLWRVRATSFGEKQSH